MQLCPFPTQLTYVTQSVGRVPVMVGRGGWAVRVVMVELHLYAVNGVYRRVAAVCVTPVKGWVSTMIVHALQVLFRMQGIHLFPGISDALSP